MSREQRQSPKLLKPRSSDAHKNITVPMIAILNYSEVNMEVSDAGMETTDSDNCREISRDNGDANGVLAITWKKARSSHKDGWKFIDLFV